MLSRFSGQMAMMQVSVLRLTLKNAQQTIQDAMPPSSRSLGEAWGSEGDAPNMEWFSISKTH